MQPLNFRRVNQYNPTRRRLRKDKTKPREIRKPQGTFWTIDCETDPFHACDDVECSKCHGLGRVPKDFIWGAYCGDTDQYEEYATATDVAEAFASRKSTVYAHNGGKFDYHYLRDHINADDTLMIINGRLARFKIGECEFRDSLNIFPNTRLKDFGIKEEIDYELMEPDKRNDPNVLAEIKRYLRQDCIGLWGVVDRYRRDYGNKLTQAGASMKYWEKNYYKADAPRQTRRQQEEYRPYYNGGRVQCFEHGTASQEFKVADINSAYPYAMLEPHPIECEGDISTKLPKDHLLSTTLIKVEGTSRGALPWRDPKTQELYFPDDEGGHRKRRRVYYVTGHEFIAALELNALDVHKIRECHIFRKRVDFRAYMDHFYELREVARLNGDVAGRIFGKYFMASLYGKFGADPDQYFEFVIATEDSYARHVEQGYEPYKLFGKGRMLMCRELPDAQKRFYNVATAASVTGYVRAHLFRALSKCSGLIYCDTDSIAARETTGIEYGTKLGQWKHEGLFDRYSIAGKKLYAFHKAGAAEEFDPDASEKEHTWKIAAKGIKIGNSTEAPDIIRKLAGGEKVRVINEVPCYTITREKPVFVHRTVKKTFRDMAIAPEPVAA